MRFCQVRVLLRSRLESGSRIGGSAGLAERLAEIVAGGRENAFELDRAPEAAQRLVWLAQCEQRQTEIIMAFGKIGITLSRGAIGASSRVPVPLLALEISQIEMSVGKPR